MSLPHESATSGNRAQMTGKPIIFSAPMICALLEGRKTQTRRVVKPQPAPYAGGVHPSHVARHPTPYIDAYCGEKRTATNPRGMSAEWFWWTEDDRLGPSIGRCPYGAPGDLLWARETWAPQRGFPHSLGRIWYRATDGENIGKQFPMSWLEREKKWRPSIHMPRWASRLTLRLTDVRVQRLHEISEKDAKAEGALVADIVTGRALLDQNSSQGSYRWGFRLLWQSLYGPGSWDANPYVWALTFSVIQKNIDEVTK